MKTIQLSELSRRYSVRRLCMDDAEMLLAFCKRNTQYYLYCGKEPDLELIRQDLQIAPPGIPMEQKYYTGFFEGGRLVAVMDLVAGYPDEESAFIGFFMMDRDRQGKGIGSGIISEALACLRRLDFHRCQLGIDKDNPQSNRFWKKNGFEVIREVKMDEGTVLLAEKKL